MSGRLAVVGAGTVLSGDMAAPVVTGADAVLCEDGLITAVGAAEELRDEIAAADQVVDAHGSTVAPGLIDSHCHVVLGDYTPRQKTVDFLASYVHGGITSVVSPGEIPAPGRPHARDRRLSSRRSCRPASRRTSCAQRVRDPPRCLSCP